MILSYKLDNNVYANFIIEYIHTVDIISSVYKIVLISLKRS